MTISRKTQPDPDSPASQLPHPHQLQKAKQLSGWKSSGLWQWIWFVLRYVLPYYCGIVLMLAYFQRTLMYPATRMDRITTQDAGMAMGQVHDITMRSTDGLTLHGWHILPHGKTAVNQEGCDELLKQGGKVILFFSGNGGNRMHRREDYQELVRMNCHVFVFDYRGYGENPGAPSEKKLTEDARQAWKYVTTERKVAPNRVVLYGESLGGGVATRLAADVCAEKSEPAGLILRSTFSSMVDAASYNYPWLPVWLVLLDRYPSIQRIPLVTCPILMLHGTKDTIVPFSLGKRLFQATPSESSNGILKTFVELPSSGHNDVLLVDGDLFRQNVTEFLRKLK